MDKNGHENHSLINGIKIENSQNPELSTTFAETNQPNQNFKTTTQWRGSSSSATTM